MENVAREFTTLLITHGTKNAEKQPALKAEKNFHAWTWFRTNNNNNNAHQAQLSNHKWMREAWKVFSVADGQDMMHRTVVEKINKPRETQHATSFEEDTIGVTRT